MKRFLSLFVACLMLVTVFSGLAVYDVVSAAETTTYTLPMNWARGLKKDSYGWDLAETADGIWRLTSFADLDDVSTMRWEASTGELVNAESHDDSPESYIESWDNRNILASTSGWTDRWYVNFGTRHQNKSFDYGDNATYIKVLPGCVNGGSNGGIDENNNPTVVFTAPEAGTYEYSEFVKLVMDGATVEVTVRKNGTALVTKTATAAGETISGEVELAKGDLLMFAFELKSETTVKDATPVINLSNVVVSKVNASGSEGGQGGSNNVAVGTKWDLPTDFYTCNPGAGTKINGEWQLANYDTQTQITYYNFQAAGSGHSASNWYFDATEPHGAKSGQCGTFAFGTRGFETNPGHDDHTEMASAIIFTAPDDGIYKFDVDTFSYGTNAGKTGSRTVIFYVMKDGVIYDITNPKYNLDNTENMTGEIALKKGEQVYFCAQRYTRYSKIGTGDWPAWIGARYDGLSVEKVAELPENAELVTKYTFAPDGTSLVNGQFEMKAYDLTTKTASDATLATGADWSVSASSGNKLFWKTGTTDAVVGWGPDGSTTNANEGAAIVFTAPADGTYNITGHFEKTYVKSAGAKHYCDYKIILADGTVVFDGTNYDESQLEEFNNLVHTFGASVELAQGEKVYIVKSPNASAVVGAQGGDIYALTVTQLAEVEATHECHGGTATCTAPATCDECGQPYGSKDLTNHVSDCVATYTKTALKHTATMSKCGTVLPAESHNIVNGECTVCGYEEVVIPGPWNLPMNWSVGNDVDENGWDLASFHGGLWRLTSFADLSDITTIRDAASSVQATEGLDPNANNSKTPQSYIESLNNRKKLVAGVTSYDRWYVNFGYRWQNKAFDYGDNATYIKVLPGCVNNGGSGAIEKNNNPTVVFTAPKTGTYNYSEFVKLTLDGATVEVTVRKNGVVLKSTTATTAGETISGEVELAKGDLLMFAFTLTSETTVADSTPVINLSNVAVSEVDTTGNEGNQGGSTVAPDTGVVSVIVFICAAVASVATGKIVATKRRRNG